ncbi:MAG: 3-phosphoshikimate 1-carboxyvinyltransferase [Ignavibacteria bacterium]|nr:3-phosphoshikimate 1-carboxyvinyltransferase [Ignavibacteria bacterium]
MMREIIPLSGPLNASPALPGSKSITNRALICAALAAGESCISNASDCDDTALMVNGLNQLGILVRRSGPDLIVEGGGGRVFGPKYPIPVGNGGTTFRFLFALAALADRGVTFEAGGRMTERPVDSLLDAFRDLGVNTEAMPFAGRFAVGGGGLRGGAVMIRGEESSQFISAVLMVSPYASDTVRITVPGKLVSAPYVQMTIDIMKTFGVQVQESSGVFEVIPVKYRPARLMVEPDLSAAAIFLSAGLLAGGTLRFAGSLQSTVQGDTRIFDLLQQTGASMERPNPGEVRFHNGDTGAFHGIDADLGATPDLVPPLACAMLFAESPSFLRNIAHLRHKESDRLDVLVREIRKLGGEISVEGDGLEIRPSRLHGAGLDPEDDHRLAMSLALTGLRVPGVTLNNPGCVKKSFPGFWEQFALLEGKGD